MTRTTRPTVEAILAALPELASYARDAFILHPERAEPDPWSSSIGGPLLWPRDEPWPECSLPDASDPAGSPAAAMVPVAQIFRRDVPGPGGPSASTSCRSSGAPMNTAILRPRRPTSAPWWSCAGVGPTPSSAP